MTITALPALNRLSATFKTDVDTFFGTQIPAFVTETNATAAAVDVSAASAAAQVTLAAAQVTLATAQTALATTQATNAALSATSAASSALTAGASIWVSGTTYAIGNARYSPANGQTYRRLTEGAGTTDPSADATNWIVINGLTSEAIPLPANNLPSVRPSLNLNFASSQVVDPRITFTRASTATRTNSRGLIETVASGSPRIDYDPVTLACKGLLFEEARTNLLTYSEVFDNVSWTKEGTTIGASATAPDGSTTADKLVEDATNAPHRCYKTISATAIKYTYSVYVKAAERSWCLVSIQTNAGVSYGKYVNLSSGAIGSPTSIPEDFTVQDVGNGWYRVTVTQTNSGVGNFYGMVWCATGDGVSTYVGDITKGVYAWGAQLEAGAFPTSYIPTTSAAVTRAADVASITSTNFSSWYRQDEGGFVVNFDSYSPSTTGHDRVFEVNDGTANNLMAVIKNNGTNSYFCSTITYATASQAYLYTSAVTANTFATVALGYKLNDTAQSFAGAAVVTDTSVTIPTITQMAIGGTLGANPLNGHIKHLIYYPKRLSNAELVALSTQ